MKKSFVFLRRRIVLVLYSAAFAIFLWTLIALLERVADVSFFAPVRGSGLVQFSTAYYAFSAQIDGPALLISGAFLLTVYAVKAWTTAKLGTAESLFVISISLLACSSLVAANLDHGEMIDIASAVLLATSLASIAIYSILRARTMFREESAIVLSSVLIPTLAIFTFVSIISSARWVTNGFEGSMPLANDWSWFASSIVLKMSNVLYPYLARLVIIFFLALILRFILPIYQDNLRSIRAKFQKFFVAPGSSGDYANRSELMSRTATRFMLGLAAILAAFIGIYSYLPAVNPPSTLVGVDTPYYDSIGALTFNLSPITAGKYIVTSDIQQRFLYVYFQYVLTKVAGSVDLVIRLMPAILAISLVFSTYFFVKMGSGNEVLAATSALIAAVSFEVTVGINGALYANWLVISEMFVFFAVFLYGLTKNSLRYIPLCILLSAIVLATHPWTWFFLMALLVVFGVGALLNSLRNKNAQETKSRNELYYVASILVFYLALYGAYVVLFPGGGGLGFVFSQLAYVSASYILTMPSTLYLTMTTFVANGFASAALLALAIVGVLAIGDLRIPFNRFLMSWAAIASLGVAFTTFTGGLTDLQPRFLYDVPFQVFAAIGFLAILEFLGPLVRGRSQNQSRSKLFTLLSFALLISVLLSFVLQTVGYLLFAT